MKFLPKVLLLSTIFVVLLSFSPSAFAQATPTPQPVAPNLPGTVPDNVWIIDKEVTFIGKNAARSGLLLDWTLRDYNWSKVQPGATHSLIPFWLTIRNIVYALFILFVIGTAFVLIVTRGRSLAAKRFLPRFIAVVLLVTFSFSLLQFLYQVTDAIQGFFLSSKEGSICPPDCISQKDLFYWSWDYVDFEGMRLTGPANEESAFVSLFLTKLSALTYFVMVGILLVRKIILWFFIIVSPIFPLLLLYYPVRNTGKIWIGEFFRWLLYAPLFSIFLAGLVSLWRLGIPMSFLNTKVPNVPGTGVPGADTYYPTAVNILLAGPGQGANITNSINLTDTFALYMVALIMLWMVIILPWILLQIFLDYMNNISFKPGSPVRQMMNVVSNRFPPSPAPAPGGGSTGLALPFGKNYKIPPATVQEVNIPKTAGLAKELPRGISNSVPTQVPVARPTQAHAEVLRLTNLSLPTMRDIAKYESSRIANNISQSREVASMREKLQLIANPSIVSTTTDRDRYREIRDQLVQQSNAGNIMAQSILKASTIVSQSSTSTSSEASRLHEVLQEIANPAQIRTAVEKDRYVEFREKVVQESSKGNQLATSILSAINNFSKTTNIATTNISQDTQVLEHIANPNTVKSTAEREKYVELKEKLIIEKQNGNQLAGVVLNSVEKLSQATTQQEKSSVTSELRQSLVKESELGNTLAQNVLSVMSSSTSASTTSIENLEQTLGHIDNPASTTTTVEREYFTKIKESLATAQEQGNPFAANVIHAIEKLSQTSSMQERSVIAQELRESLVKEQEKGNNIASSILNSSKEIQVVTSLKETLQQLGNPGLIANTSERESIISLKEQLVKESQNNNTLATTILSATEKEVTTSEIQQLKEQLVKAKESGNLLATSLMTKVEEKQNELQTQKVKEQLEQARQKGDPVALALLTMLAQQGQKEQASAPVLPKENQIQQVSLDDYEAVKSMWVENYQNLEVPQSVTGMKSSRKEWVQDDINQIANTISLLTSNDQVKVEEGMKEVSNILPFLLIGGFSQDEIVSYLKAKMEAAKSVKTELDKSTEEEDTMLTTSTHKTEEAKTMTTTVEQQPVRNTTITMQSVGTSASDDIDESPLQQLSGQNIVSTEGTTQILKLSSLTLPTIHDIVQYETALLTKKPVAPASKIVKTLESVSNPETVTEVTERERLQKLKEIIIKESQSGNALANSILAASHVVTGKNMQVNLPQKNNVQAVSIDDYESVKKMWVENYQNLDVPQDPEHPELSREEWLRREIEEITTTLALLTSDDPAKVEEGLKRVGDILPFLLVGGFTKDEIISYLKAKLEAAKFVLESLQKAKNENDTLINVESATGSKNEQQEAEQIPTENKNGNGENNGSIH